MRYANIVFGASGLVGNALFKKLAKKDTLGLDKEIFTREIQEFDIMNIQELENVLVECMPDTIYYPLSNPNVEFIEERYCPARPSASSEVPPPSRRLVPPALSETSNA